MKPQTEGKWKTNGSDSHVDLSFVISSNVNVLLLKQMLQKPLAMAFCSSLFTCSCWMVENIGKKGHRLWAVRGERSQSLLMTHCNDDCNPIIRDQRVSGSLVPFLLQSISSEEEREIGSSIKENVFGGIFFSSPKVSFPCDFFFFIANKSPFLFF